MPKLIIGFESSLFLLGNDGPKTFMRRLKEAIRRQGLARVRSAWLPAYDIGLFKSSRKSLFSRPFVLRVDGIYYDLKETLGGNEALNAPIFESIERAGGVVFISDFSRQLIFRFYGELKKPWTVIHNAVDLRAFRPEGPNYREALHIRPEERVLVTAAHWRAWKRLRDIVDLFHRMEQEREEPLRLLILGRRPDVTVEHERIHFIGEIRPSHLAAWYRTGDLYLHLAWLEACGNTQVEAMACGLPVLCTNLGGIGETVRKADGGIVSQADEPFDLNLVDLYNPPRPDPEVLASDLHRLLDDLDGFKGRIRFHELSVDRAAEEYCTFLGQVVESIDRKRRMSKRRGRLA